MAHVDAPVRIQLLGGLDVRGVGGEPIPGIGNQPKLAAILVYLALAPDGRPRRRDDLLSIFYPESDEASARNALGQALHRLRSTLGGRVLRSSGHEVRLDEEHVWCDAAQLRRAAAAGDDFEVLRLYGGTLLESFHVRGAAPEFDTWLAGEREELRRLAVRSAWRAANAEEMAGNPTGASEWARAAVRFDPSDETGVRRLMLLLAEADDARGASRVFDAHAARMKNEFELDPSEELVELAATLRSRSLRRQGGPPVSAPEPRPRSVPPTPDAGPGDPMLPEPGPAEASTPPPAAAHGTAIRAMGVLVAAIFVALLLLPEGTTLPVLAVGDIHIESPADTALPVALILSTNLARIEGLSIVTEDRVGEVAAQLALAGRVPRGARGAAHQAGADEVVEGVLSRREGLYRLDFRRVDRRSRSASGHVVEAADILDLVDLATEAIASDLGLRAPAVRAQGGSASLVAYRLYQQGLDQLHAYDWPAAESLFRAALAEDSTFAMAAFQVAGITARADREALFARARRLAARSPERERLMISAKAALALLDPAGLAVADTLVVRYVHDPEALMAYAQALGMDERHAEAATNYRLAAELDSLSVHAHDARCRACEALEKMRVSYFAADSLDAPERVARDWVRRYPQSPQAWSVLAGTLEDLGRFEEAGQAMARANGGVDRRTPDDLTGIWIRQLRFDDVDAYWRSQLLVGDAEARKSAYWGAFVSFRTQGRLEEALAAARGFRALQGDPLLEGLALLELGRPRESAAIFEALAAPWAGETAPVLARRRAWHLAHAAAGYAAARDTATLRVVEDTVRVYGGGSAAAGDRRLHHYVRGLRLQTQGRVSEAREAFEAAMVAPYYTYVRLPFEAGRASLAADDPERAISVLTAALRGPVSAAGLYASRTELLELLGDAYAKGGQVDSAAAVYGRVLESWSRADPLLGSRVEGVRARLAALRPAGDGR